MSLASCSNLYQVNVKVVDEQQRPIKDAEVKVKFVMYIGPEDYFKTAYTDLTPEK